MSWFTQQAPKNPLSSATTMTAPPQGGTGSTAPAVQPNQGIRQGNEPANPSDYPAVIAELQKQFPATPDGFRQLLAALNARGIPAMAASHAGGSQASDDKIVLPNGKYYDIRTDNGWVAPGQALNWDPSVPVFDASGKSQNYNEFLQGKGLPTFKFTPGPEDFAGGPGQGGANLGGYGKGDFLQPWNFQAPDAQAVENSPAFQFRLKEGMQAIQRSAASKGTLLTGGTMKDLATFGSDLASTEYDKEYQRKIGEYTGGLGLKQQQFGNLFDLSQQGLTAAQGQNQAESSYGQNTNQNTNDQANVKAGTTVGNAQNYLSAAQPLIDFYRQQGINMKPKSGLNPTQLSQANSLIGK